MPAYRVAQLDEIPPADCPCGTTRRAFVAPDNRVASMHLVEIRHDTPAHRHARLTELYCVLEGTGTLEVDGDRVPLGPMTAVLIPPGCTHRATGDLRVLIVPSPPFDPTDLIVED